MTTLAQDYQFTAPITGKGKQGNGWKLEFDWNLPGSKFPFVLYGQSFDDIEGWDVGDRPNVHVARGSLKAGKEGRYSTDYFYDLVSIDNEAISQPRANAPGPSAALLRSGKGIPQESPETPPQEPETFQDHVQYRIQLGMAFNAAVSLIGVAMPIVGGIEEDQNLDYWRLRRIRYLRDRLLKEVILVPVAPPHWCYRHDVQNIKSTKTGVWGHLLEGRSPCTEEASP